MANARDIALSTAREVAEDPDRVGRFITVEDLGDGVSDFRFVCLMKGYEGWQWSVTLYHDAERDVWTVDESTLVPAEGALLPPAWVPWKDRLLPSDLSVTDVLGTADDDPRLEAGVPASAESVGDADRVEPSSDGAAAVSAISAPDEGAAAARSRTDDDAGTSAESDATAAAPAEASDSGPSEGSDEDRDEAVDRFVLTRRRVLSPLGRAQAAERWYQGQHGPRSLSTRTAGKDNPCSTCGFLVPIVGDLGRIFGVCANIWSPDDGRVVSLDHGCGEHSDIDPPELTPLWVQSAPAYDDTRIDAIRLIPRDENPEVELIEGMEDEEQPPSSDEAPEASRNEDSSAVG